MKSTFARTICRILVASMIVLPLQAGAGLIGTERAVTAEQAQALRASATDFINRAEVAAQLQALGLSPQGAKERVAALTDAEVAGLAGRIDALPAGAISGLAPFFLAIFLFWRFLLSDQAKAEAAKSEPKPKPAPAPEKK